MLANEHPAFVQPNGNVTLWRYMDLSKLLSLLENKVLFFPRADSFVDPYEGTLSRATAEAMVSSGRFKPEHVEDHRKNLANDKLKMFISCWFTSEYESAAMWKLYLSGIDGIAIKTNYESLVNQLQPSDITIRTTMVSYVDFETQPTPDFNGFYSVTHKRSSFSHENELRAIIWSREAVNSNLIDQEATSVEIKIKPSELIQAIHVSPNSPLWYGQLVEKLLTRYKLEVPIVKSTLYDRPLY